MERVSGINFLVASAALAALLPLAGCHGSEEAKDAPPVVAVQVATVAQGPLEHWVRTQAVLYPLRQAIITPKISAPVSRFFVNRGDHVHAGELLAELENRDLKASEQETQGQLEAAQAAYQTATKTSIPGDLLKAQLDAKAAQQAADNAQKILESRQQLLEQGAIAARDRDQAAVDYTNAKNAATMAQQRLAAMEAVDHAQALKAAQGDLAQAEGHAAAASANVGYSEIKSPIDGVVTDRPVYQGELATTSSPLMTIMDLDHIVARAHLPADQAATLKVGDKATVADAAGGDPLPARVTVVSPATDPGSTTIEVWVEATNPGDKLRPGISVNVAILAETIKDALTVPASALLTDPSGGTSVMVVGADSKAHQTTVEAGVKEPDTVQITKGLKVGDKVVSAGAFGLPDNTLVKIVAAPPAGAGDGDKQP
ncbi:MAG TPA: efflux RND transporter periplasmic adaptor subunit [Terriglobales bacterium]|nr:efflux RND transporter periplasmic adaptor subunit [Terriglobales bacterium]